MLLHISYQHLQSSTYIHSNKKIWNPLLLQSHKTLVYLQGNPHRSGVRVLAWVYVASRFIWADTKQRIYNYTTQINTAQYSFLRVYLWKYIQPFKHWNGIIRSSWVPLYLRKWMSILDYKIKVRATKCIIHFRVAKSEVHLTSHSI